MFVYDTKTKRLRLITRTVADFDDFVYWVYSGRVPGTGEGDEDAEPARWRSSAFVAVSGRGSVVRIAFKARTGELDPFNNVYQDPIDGIYLSRQPGLSALATVVDTLTPAQDLDPEAPPDALVTEVAIERDGFRGSWLTISAKMGEESSEEEEEEEGVAGIYIARP